MAWPILLLEEKFLHVVVLTIWSIPAAIRHALRLNAGMPALNGGVQKKRRMNAKKAPVFRPISTRMMYYLTSAYKELSLSPYRSPGNRKNSSW